MIDIFTPQQMKAIDEYAIRSLRIPSLRLMENAGNAAADEIRKILAAAGNGGSGKVVILCGKGNNGGDGFVTARLMAESKISVTVVLIENAEKISGDALINFSRLEKGEKKGLSIHSFKKFQNRKNAEYNVIVDAMLGTSFRGKLKGNYLKAVQWSNRQSAVRIAVDIPTGLNGETGQVISDAFKADVTVTLSNPKTGFFCGGAKEYTGDLYVADIGIPPKAQKKIASLRQYSVRLIEPGDIHSSFPGRKSNSHKHSVGKIFVLAGSKSMMGAALLCSESAMRSGAGQVIAGIPDSEYPVIAKRTVEVMPLGLPSTMDGTIAAAAMGEIVERMRWADVVLIGCGMSRIEETQQVIRNVVLTCSKPMVIDADGLIALAGHLEILKRRKSKHVTMTPHAGEFSRLTGIPADQSEGDKFSIASGFAKEHNVILVLKGAPTIVADRKGNITVNSTGNPGMSTAGSGDVLAGIIASFVGQGNKPVDAAVNGVFIHGRAGDIAERKIGMHGMIASDMAAILPAAIREIVGQ